MTEKTINLMDKKITGEMIKKIRKQLQLTQKEFVGLVNTSVPTIERWEISDKEITGPIVLVVLLHRPDNLQKEIS